MTNIREHLVNKLDVDDFQRLLFDSILDSMEGAMEYKYSEKDINEITELKKDKFSTWEWKFGYSPRYQFTKALRYGDGEIALHMNVEKGIIKEVSIEGDFLGSRDIHALEDVLVGTIHDPATIRMRLSGIKVEEYIAGLGNEKLLSGMF